MKDIFFCTACGNEYANWAGQCPACKAWDTLVSRPFDAEKSVKTERNPRKRPSTPQTLREIKHEDTLRFSTGMGELDRVLGGGAVKGSVVLVAGEPGIGKSTMLLQICEKLAEGLTVLYVTGEESPGQLKLRASRLGLETLPRLYIYAETDMDDVLDAVETLSPDVLVLDSIQTMMKTSVRGVTATPGNVAQVKECTLTVMNLAKTRDVTVFIVGHVNKEGAIAGPKVLEHMVDCVLYFEGDRQLSYRILRAAKNRFGSTNEIGLFDMQGRGLVEVPNPSEYLLDGRPRGVSGTCVACIMEGTRPLLAEVQALVTKTSFGTPRRMVSGFDFNRAMLLLAVLEKRVGVFLGSFDAYINIVGGLRVDEPAMDLPVLIACASSAKDQPVPDSVCAFGEVGLTGELRSVPHLHQRIAEIHRLGFTKCIIPKQGTRNVVSPAGVELIRVKHVREAFAQVFTGA